MENFNVSGYGIKHPGSVTLVSNICQVPVPFRYCKKMIELTKSVDAREGLTVIYKIRASSILSHGGGQGCGSELT
jgi:hypothetical protein